MAEFNEIKTPDMHEPWDGKGFPPGVKPTLLALAGALLVAAIPYAVTPLIPEDSELHEKVGDFRVWIDGDDLPFSKHFRTSRPKPAHVPEAGAVAAAPGAEEPGAAAPGGDDPGLPEVPVIAVAPEAPPATKPGPAEPGVVPPPEPPQNPLARIQIPASTWEGLSTFIEDPNGALAHFYGQLAKVALKEDGAMARISHFGDSAIAADGMPSSARRLLQRTFGDGGHGFSLVAATNAWYRRKDIEWTSKGWTGEAFISDDAKDRRYGFGGTAATGFSGAKATWKTVEVDPKQGEHTVGTRASRFTVHYLAQKGGGAMALSVDGVEKQVVDTASDTLEDRVVTLEVPDGPHTFELKNAGGGKIKVYGAIIERASGVVYDGLGTIGARDTRWENFDEAHAKTLFATRGTDLAVFMYGGNQLEDKLSMASYQVKLTEIVRLWKAGLGERSCLMMSPMDHGERHRGKVRTVPRQLDIMKVQKEVALAEGCAWFSLYDAMGGNGSIGDWYDQKLAEGDLAHPTSRGAVILGQLFFKALMKGFAEHLERAVGGGK